MGYYPKALENAKDKNYAFIVLVASFLSRTIMFGMVYSSGIYYIAVLDELNTTKAQASWMGSMLLACLCMASIFSSMLHNKLGPQLTAVIGGCIAFVGFCSSSFAMHIYFLFFSYGIVAGLGLGLNIIPIVVSVSDFFDKYKHIAQSGASTGSSFGTFISPIIVERLVNHYGWRGSLLISSAAILNLSALGLLFRSFYDDPLQKSHVCAATRQYDLRTMDWTILKHRGLMTACTSAAMMSFGSSLIFIHLSAYAQWDAGLDSKKAAILLALTGGIGIFGRLFYGFIVGRKVSPYLILVLCSVVTGVSTVILPSIKSFPALIMYSMVVGLALSSSGGAVWPALLIDLLGESHLATSYGIINCISALGSLIGPPVAGILYDVSGSYIYSFVVGGMVSSLAGLILFPVWKLSKRVKMKAETPPESLLVVEMLTSL